jgi:hypothetical protein
MATLRGEPVDRPAVSFYELNGLDQNPDNPDPMNVYSHPSWRPLLELTREKTDCIVMRGVAFKEIAPDPIAHLAKDDAWQQDGSIFTRRTVVAGNRTLSMQTRHDRDVDTIWTTEHLLKGPDDLRAFSRSATDADGRSCRCRAVSGGRGGAGRRRHRDDRHP